ncbi:MAG: response regulator transcription factor [Chthoniobacterales bacterium]|nr:response regulator transcription factor [Chthoniobacterales bacterium]
MMSNSELTPADGQAVSQSVPAGPSRTNKLRIFIADDHELLRAGVRRLVESRGDWEVCGEAADGREIAKLVRQLKADVVVLDLTLRGAKGIDVAKEIKATTPSAEVLIFSGDDSPASIHAAFQAGAASYIRKGDDYVHLVNAIASLAEHKPYLTPDVSKVILGAFFSGGPKPEALTDRELEIVRLLCEGNSNQRVATQLGISPRTVEVHRATVMRKLELDTFAELVRYAVRNNLVEA